MVSVGLPMDLMLYTVDKDARISAIPMSLMILFQFSEGSDILGRNNSHLKLC